MVVFTDLHIHNYKRFDTNGSRLKNCLEVLELMFAEADKQEDKTILFAGDLFDSHKVLPIRVINETVFLLKTLFEQHPGVIFVAISGNHDMGAKSLYGRKQVTSLDFLADAFPNRFFLIDNGYLDIDDHNRIHGLPYYDDGSDFKKALEDLQPVPGKFNILLIHQTPDGTELPVHADFRIGDLFAKYDHVFCGHIHKRQELTDSFTIVGTPLHRDFGDAGQEKGYYTYNLPDLTFHSTRGRWPEFEYNAEALPEGEEQSTYTQERREAPEAINTLTQDYGTNIDENIGAYLREVESYTEELFKIGLELCK